MREDDYFGHVLADDLKVILRDIREEHSNDTTTADTPSNLKAAGLGSLIEE